MGVPTEGKARVKRTIRRFHEPSRLEEELWSLAYEDVWPIVSRSTRGEQREQARPSQQTGPGRRRAHTAGA
jgi:hypothetical protein